MVEGLCTAIAKRKVKCKKKNESYNKLQLYFCFSIISRELTYWNEKIFKTLNFIHKNDV